MYSVGVQEIMMVYQMQLMLTETLFHCTGSYSKRGKGAEYMRAGGYYCIIILDSYQFAALLQRDQNGDDAH